MAVVQAVSLGDILGQNPAQINPARGHRLFPPFYRNPAWRLELRQGVRAALPAAPGVVAWGLVTGVAMVKSGLAVPWAIAISLLVYAGSAQLATLPLIVAGQPFWIVAL